MGIAAMLLMALGIILFVLMYQRRVIQSQIEIERVNKEKQAELVHASIQSEEEERSRIASELHDDIGAHLASVSMYLYTAMNKPDNNAMLLQAKGVLDESIKKVRNLSHKLQPAMLMHLGLAASLESFVKMISQSGNISVALHQGQAPLPALNETTALYAYRIVQELIANIMRHGKAQQVDIYCQAGNEALHILLQHNGQGIQQTDFEQFVYKTGASGLKNLVNRLSLLHADISFTLNHQNGLYEIIINIPLKPFV